MVKQLIGLMVLVFSFSTAQAEHNLDFDDIKTCGNKQFLVKLWNSKLSYEEQKKVIWQQAKALGYENQIGFVGTGFTPQKELVISLTHKPRGVASVSPVQQTEHYSNFKKLVDQLDAKNNVSYAECHVVFSEK